MKGQTILTVPIKLQGVNSNWCWVAASQCVLEYYGTNVTQCDIANYTKDLNNVPPYPFGTSNCCGSPNGCNQPNWLWDWPAQLHPGNVYNILQALGNLSTSCSWGALTQNSIEPLLQNKQLFLIGWTGHVVVGYGISGNNIYFMDPSYGDRMELYSYMLQNGNRTWDQTMVIQKFKLKLFFDGYYTSSNVMREAMDGNTGLPQWGSGIADKVDIEFHNSTNPWALVQTYSNVNLSTDGIVSELTKDNITGNYYIAVKQRNHIITCTDSAVSMSFNTVNHDFTDSVEKAYGTDAQISIDNSPYLWGFYGADLNQDGWVDALDWNIIADQLLNGSCGFQVSDINGDGCVDALDWNIMEPRLEQGTTAQLPWW